MKTEKMQVEQALMLGMALPYAYLRCLSEVYLGKTPAVVELAELQEARFFNGDVEIRIFAGEGTHQAVKLTVGKEDRSIEESYDIMGHGEWGRTLTVRHILSADEDGQTYVQTTCLAGWEGGVSRAEN